MPRSELAKKVKILRIEKSWSQAQLAEISGLSLRTIQRLENTGTCSKETLLAIASSFDIDIKELTKFLTNETKEFNFFERFVNITRLNKLSPKKVGIISFIIILPSIYFVCANILKYSFEIDFLHSPLTTIYNNPQLFKAFNLISPFYFLGSLLFTIFTNSIILLRFKFYKTNDSFISNISFTPKALNILSISISLLFFIVMFGYAVLENLN